MEILWAISRHEHDLCQFLAILQILRADDGNFWRRTFITHGFSFGSSMWGSADFARAWRSSIRIRSEQDFAGCFRLCAIKNQKSESLGTGNDKGIRCFHLQRKDGVAETLRSGRDVSISGIAFQSCHCNWSMLETEQNACRNSKTNVNREKRLTFFAGRLVESRLIWCKGNYKCMKHSEELRRHYFQ